ncbi:unnamed protein product, partial [Symbiodinium pilosum]
MELSDGDGDDLFAALFLEQLELSDEWEPLLAALHPAEAPESDGDADAALALQRALQQVPARGEDRLNDGPDG